MQSLSFRLKSIHFVLIALIILEGIPISLALAADEIRVENVRYEVVGMKAVIYYDLVGAVDKEYKVSVTLKRRGDVSFSYIPNFITGDVGKGNFLGKGRQVNWDFSREFPLGLEYEDYFFVVDADIVSGGISAVVWLGGAALVGGAVAYLLLKKEEAAPPIDTGFPNPPGRPR